MQSNMSTWKVLVKMERALSMHGMKVLLSPSPPLGAPPCLPHGVPQLSLLQTYAQMEQDVVLACIAASDHSQ